jgi:cobalt/nickel transport system permease protein
VHLAEGTLPLAHAAAWTGAALPWLAAGTARLRRATEADRALASMAAAITFAVTLVAVPIPIAGMSSHLCATPVLGLLLGPSAIIVPATVVLAVQALLFGHGGLTTLGVNSFTLGLVGPAVAISALTLLGLVRLRGPAAVFVACTARRRPALVPARLSRTPALSRGVPSLLLFALGLLLASPAAGELPGADDVVLAGAARTAGRVPTAPIAGRSEEDVGRGTFFAGGLVAGILLGRGWTRVGGAGARRDREG